MVFCGKSYRKCPVPTFRMGEKVLKKYSSYKYLGHFISEDLSDNNDISEDLSDNNDISRQCRSVFAKGNSLIRAFHKCSDAAKVTLFKAYCTNMYTAELWCNFTQAAIRKLVVAYHGVFKKCWVSHVIQRTVYFRLL